MANVWNPGETPTTQEYVINYCRGVTEDVDHGDKGTFRNHKNPSQASPDLAKKLMFENISPRDPNPDERSYSERNLSDRSHLRLEKIPRDHLWNGTDPQTDYNFTKKNITNDCPHYPDESGPQVNNNSARSLSSKILKEPSELSYLKKNSQKYLAEELEEFYAVETLKKLKYIGQKIWVAKISLFRSRNILHLTAENFPSLVNSVSNKSIDVFLGFNLYKHLYALYRVQPLSFEDFHKLLSEKEDSWWVELIGSTCIEFKLKGLNLAEGYMQNREFKAALLKSISVKVGNPLV